MHILIFKLYPFSFCGSCLSIKYRPMSSGSRIYFLYIWIVLAIYHDKKTTNYRFESDLNNLIQYLILRSSSKKK